MAKKITYVDKQQSKDLPAVSTNKKFTFIDANHVKEVVNENYERLLLDWNSDISAGDVMPLLLRVERLGVIYKVTTSHTIDASKTFVESNYEVIGSSSKAIENSYADWATLLADQANQLSGYIYIAIDASGFSTVTSGYAYFEYLGTTSGTEADYRLLTAEEGGGGTGVFEPVQDITELKALDTTDAFEYPDKWAILVEDQGQFYRLDRDSAVSESLPRIVEPTTGTGRWISDQDVQLQGKADKATGHTTGNLAELDVSGNPADSGIDGDPIDLYDVPSDVKTYLENNANWTGDTLTVTGFAENGDKGQRYTSTVTGYTYEVVDEPSVWARYPLNLDTVDIITMSNTDKTKLETSGNWNGVEWRTASNGGEDLNTDSTGMIHYDGTYFYWVISNNFAIRLTRA